MLTDCCPETKLALYLFILIVIIGAVDGTHIAIKPPADHKNDYCSRKTQFGINLTAACDANLNLIGVFSGFSAKVHDSRVFKQSDLYKVNIPTIPRKYHILGDAAYALHINVMTPFKDMGGRGLTLSQRIYNNKHSQTRMAIERCFGVLKSRWLKLSSLDSEIERWNQVVVACCVLHNMCQPNTEVRPPQPRNAEFPQFHVLDNWTEQEKRNQIVQFLLHGQQHMDDQ